MIGHMLPISPDILKQFDIVLEKKAIPSSLRADYKKWLRYCLDFRAKYQLPDSRSEHKIQKLVKIRMVRYNLYWWILINYLNIRR